MAASGESHDLISRIERLEARVARLESCAEFDLPEDESGLVEAPSEEAIERQLAQTWFARIGVLALAAGGAYVLLQPYPTAPAALPSIVGWIVAACLFLVAHLGRNAFALVSRHARGVAMALLYCAALRMCYFGATPALAPGTVWAHVLLPVAAAVNLAIAWRRRSSPLMALALLTATVTPIALSDAKTVLVSVAVLTLVVAFVGTRPQWGALLGGGTALVYLMYVAWAMGNPIAGAAYGWVTRPVIAPVVVLASIGTLATAPLWLRAPCDTPLAGAAASANAICGYGALLIHSYAIHHPWFTDLHIAAAVVLLAAAFALCFRLGSQIATFIYAMAAYAALTVAIVHIASVPKVFVWLSLESVVVVATAIWFRSRFIVVTNFIIYAIVVLGYVVLNTSESGVSIGFGLVALVSARILNWQRHRLALKTELMRNAYLACAFVVFPYSLFHLAGARYAALAWVGLAGVYYGLNVLIRNQKYRWMAHATLVLTAGYLLVPGHEGMTMAWRLTSFIALGAAFLGVSVMSTLSRR